MDCDVSREQLWSWVDRDAAELDEHVAGCPDCRKAAGGFHRSFACVPPSAQV